MTDSSVLLDMLARRGSPSMAAATAPPSSEVESYMRYARQAMAERDDAKMMLDTFMAEANKERKALEQTIADLTAKANAAEAAKAAAEAKCAMIESKPPVVVDNSSEPLRAENADLRVECATYKAKCAALEDTVRMHVTTAAKQDARIAALSVVKPIEPPEKHESMEYDIDVVRGADDRIRSLKVRCTD